MNKYIILALALTLAACGGADEENSLGYSSSSGKSISETTDQNDTISTAQAVSIGSSISGSIGATDIHDVYQFEVEKDQQIVINFDGHSGSDVDIYLFNSDRGLLRASHEEGSQESMSYDASYTGTLYLVVEHYEGPDSSYQMSIAQFN